MTVHEKLLLVSAVLTLAGFVLGRLGRRANGQARYLEGCEDGAADERRMWESSRDKAIWDHRFDLAEATEALLAEADAVLSASLPSAERRALPMSFDEETGTWEAVTAQLRVVA